MSSRNAAVVIARKSTPEGGYPLFDHLVGAGEQRLRNFERERLRSLSLPAAPRSNFADYLTSSSLWHPDGAKSLHRLSDRFGDSRSAGWRREHLLFSAINDHSGLKKHGRHM